MDCRVATVAVDAVHGRGHGGRYPWAPRPPSYSHYPRRCLATVPGRGRQLARAELGAIWRRKMGSHYPAMSMVFVEALLDTPAKIELEATAVLPGPVNA